MLLSKEKIKDILNKNANGYPFIINIDVSKDELVDIANMIGNNNSKAGHFFTDKDTGSFTQVRHDGLFSNIEMGWHYAGTAYQDTKEVTEILYCKHPGSYGITSFCNTKSFYDSLGEEMQDIVKDINVKISTDVMLGKKKPLFGNEVGIPISEDSEEYKFFNKTMEVWKPLVVKHPWNHSYSLNNFVPGMIEDWTYDKGNHGKFLWESILDNMFSHQYVYNHHWKKGDLIFYDQYSSLHKRTETKGNRVMYRFALDNKNIIDYVD